MRLRMICKDKSLVDGPGYLAAGESYRIGRSSSCSFVVSDLSVSRYHAEVLVTDDGVRVRDLKSRNGTFVDGVRVEEGELQPGQSVSFGSAQFHLLGEGQEPISDENLSAVSTHFMPTKAGPLPAGLELLSQAQRGVLDLLLTGVGEKQIASKLEISPNTVHNHVKAIHRKLGVSSRTELLALFISESPQAKTEE